jgi:chemotaxis receptor (MCP) glutamine deamidase CheD
VGALARPLLPNCPTDLTAGATANPAIGKLNSEAAIEVLEAEGFKIIASSLGGNLGRQLQIHTGTGEAALGWLGKTRAEDVVDE